MCPLSDQVAAAEVSQVENMNPDVPIPDEVIERVASIHERVEEHRANRGLKPSLHGFFLPRKETLARNSKARSTMNCLPFLGHEKWEAFFMRVDLRVKHDIEARKAAIGLFELGHGYKSAAIALSLPVEAVRRWQEIYRAFGSEVLLRMDGKQGRYTYEQRSPPPPPSSTAA